MIDRSIRIRNIYTMLTYAFRSINPSRDSAIAAQRFDCLHDLFAEILLRGVTHEIRRGLRRDYVTVHDTIPGVRGWIDVTETACRTTQVRSLLACIFDEYSLNSEANQAIKGVLRLLLSQGDVSKERRLAIRRVLPYLAEVADVNPKRVRWRTLFQQRISIPYRLLLGVCELVVLGMIPNEATGQRRLTQWADDDRMSRLYERFILEYFRHHFPELNPEAPWIEWNLAAGSERPNQLPSMHTDVTLRNGNNSLIIDAKYYNHALSARFGKTTVRSGHLYQIHAYVKNADPHLTGNVSGVLLYAGTDEHESPDLDIVVGGNRIGARSLDLDAPWPKIAETLNSLVDWIPQGPGETAGVGRRR